MSVRDLRARSMHLYDHPEDATPEDVRDLVVMAEALREARDPKHAPSWVLVLSVYINDDRTVRTVLSQPHATDDEVLDLGARLLAKMGMGPA